MGLVEEGEPIIFYDAYLELFKGTRIEKARKLNRLKLIEEISKYEWRIKPIPGYNETSYKVIWDPARQRYYCDGKNCVTNNRKGQVCAHIIAVNLFLKIRKEHETGRFEHLL